jgi:A/G-specific adenine glycosylase
VCHARDLPWRRTLDPYAIWVSEIMLQQTQVKTVIPYWSRWLKALPDIHALANASPMQVLKLWEGLGYYSRARNLHRAAQSIMREHHGRFPEDFDDVLPLPGIGRYTAGAICSIAFGQPAPILDGNVIRVLTRLFGINRDPRERSTNGLLWKLAETLVVTAARKKLRSTRLAPISSPCSLLNQALMELGAVVCTPRQPRCFACPARARCEAFRQGRADEIRRMTSRAKAISRRVVAFAVIHRGRWMLRQRPLGAVNAQLWEFPNVEVNGGKITAAKLVAKFGWRVRRITPLPVVRHSITRYRILVEPFRIELTRKPVSLSPEARWFTAEESENLAFAAAHRRIWRSLFHGGVT